MAGVQRPVLWHKLLMLCCAGCASICLAEGDAASAPIPASESAQLQQQLTVGLKAASSVEVRRACKGVIRRADALIDASPQAPNRFELLGLVFAAQKHLMALEATEQNRAALFETCKRLQEAPDRYAEERLEAEMLLSERDLAAANATVAQRLAALRAMLASYRGTSAEWKSLMIGSLIATKLLDFDFNKEISDTMVERFAGDHKVIAFRRKTITGPVHAIFSGKFETSAGTTVAFPYDLVGHQYFACFWSKEMPEWQEQLQSIREVQESQDQRFEVFSFNLDELPDAGEGLLRQAGIDWTALRVPGGVRSSAAQAYAMEGPCVVWVNGQGHALLQPPVMRQGLRGRVVTQDWNVSGLADRGDSERYLAQMRYLFNGDFLVASGVEPAAVGQASGIPSQMLEDIQACFVLPPLRYRLSRKEAIANDHRAEALCAAALDAHGRSKDAWVVRNRRIIALLGLANLEQNASYLDQAVEEAKLVLGLELPPGADVVARFCLIKAALRDGGADPEKLLRSFVSQLGGDDCPQAALAAAAVLAVETNARTAYEGYRHRLLATGDACVPPLWPVCAFLRDRNHQYRNFYASPGGNGYARPAKYAYRNMVSGLAEPMDVGRHLTLTLDAVGGGKITIPDDYAGTPLGIILVEPPASVSAQSNLMHHVESFAKSYVESGVRVVVAFLSEDKETVGGMVKQLGMDCPAGLLPGGLGNPLVLKLGILSADRVPNPLLLREDGTIAWASSGIEYPFFWDRGMAFSVVSAIRSNIEKIRCDRGFYALENGDFKKALKLFGKFEPTDSRHDYWASDRLQGTALAHMGLGDWQTALTDIDAAIARRRDDFKSAMCKCHGVVEMLLTKAMILEKLEMGREATMARRMAAGENLPHAKLPPGLARAGVPVGVYYAWLKRIRLEMDGAATSSE